MAFLGIPIIMRPTIGIIIQDITQIHGGIHTTIGVTRAGMLDFGTLITIGILRDIIGIITVMEENIVLLHLNIEEILPEDRVVWLTDALEIVNSGHLLNVLREMASALNAVR